MLKLIYQFISLAILPSLISAVQGELYTGCVQEGHFAFTFDQGPSAYTGLLLRTLAKHKVKATFHVLTDYLQNPVILAYLRKAATEGHLIGLYVKEDVKNDEEQVKRYVKDRSAIIKKHTGQDVKFLRFPAPGPDPHILHTVSSMGYTVTGYNLDSLDYEATGEGQDREGTIYRVFRGVEDAIDAPALGAFISVQNDMVQASVSQADAIIAYTLQKGYKVVRLDQCVNQQQSANKEVPPVNDASLVEAKQSNNQNGGTKKIDMSLQWSLLIAFAVLELVFL